MDRGEDKLCAREVGSRYRVQEVFTSGAHLQSSLRQGKVFGLGMDELRKGLNFYVYLLGRVGVQGGRAAIWIGVG
jgi:hypothetical protein